MIPSLSAALQFDSVLPWRIPREGGIDMTTKFLALAGVCVFLVVSCLRFMASPGIHVKGLRRTHPRSSPSPDEPEGLTKTQAEDLLDWLEAHDIQGREVSYQPGKGFFIQ
jgi:hypothetical protein